MPYDNRDSYGDTNNTGAPDTDNFGGRTPQEREAEALKQAKESAYSQLRSAYRRLLKREADDSELETHLNGRYDSATVQRALQSVEFSLEAQRIRDAARTTPGTRTGDFQDRNNNGIDDRDETGGASTTFTPREERDKLQWGNVGNLEGFQVGSDYGGGEGGLKARNSVKNTFGRIASRYPATPEGLRQVVQDPEFRAAFPNARLIDHPTGDKIDFGGVLSDFESGSPVGIVDVGRSFSGAGQREQTAWVWQPEGTSAASYNATQRAIMNQNDPRLQAGTQREPEADVRAAVMGTQDPLAQYASGLLEYLRIQEMQRRGLIPGVGSPEPPLF